MIKEVKLEVGSDDLGLCWSSRLCVVDVGLGKVVSADYLMNMSLLEHFHLF